MATSGLTNFELDITDIVEEAYERIGKIALSGYQFATARRSLDLMFREWENEGLHLWNVTNEDLTLSAGTREYNLPFDVVDVLEAVVRTNDGASDQSDININRISVSDYSRQTNKNSQGRPTQYFLGRTQRLVTLTLWPVPDQTYTLNYWAVNRIEDSGTLGTTNPDIPHRFYPAMVAGLAYQLALKNMAEAGPMIPTLKAEYDRQYELAAEAHRERAPLKLVPKVN